MAAVTAVLAILRKLYKDEWQEEGEKKEEKKKAEEETHWERKKL